MTKKSSTYIQSADRPDIEFKIACDVIESVEFGKMYGFYDTSQATFSRFPGDQLIVYRCCF